MNGVGNMKGNTKIGEGEKSDYFHQGSVLLEDTATKPKVFPKKSQTITNEIFQSMAVKNVWNNHEEYTSPMLLERR